MRFIKVTESQLNHFLDFPEQWGNPAEIGDKLGFLRFGKASPHAPDYCLPEIVLIHYPSLKEGVLADENAFPRVDAPETDLANKDEM